ncbi:MAG: PAS domain-containing protein [Gammaproteobacteria bacterium]|nr:PAS domain-containing protein [Gammaproteobacteria bacterium]
MRSNSSYLRVLAFGGLCVVAAGLAYVLPSAAGGGAACLLPLAVLAVGGGVLLLAGLRTQQRMRRLLEQAWTRDDLVPGVAPPAAGDALTDSFAAFLTAIERRVGDLADAQLDGFAHNRLVAYQKRCAEAALETLPDGVLIMDESGVATYANGRIEALIGVAAEAIVGRKPHEWCERPEIVTLLSRYYSNVTRLRRGDKLELTFEGDNVRRVAVWARPLEAKRAAGSTMVVLRDVSSEALARKSRDDFVGHVAHELKSPLNVIRMHTELIADVEDGLGAEAVNSLNVIEDEVDRLANLVNDLLSLTRLESGALEIDRQRVKLTAMLEDAFETVRRAAAAQGLTTSLDVSPRLGVVALDKDLFRIALNNLLANAVKYNKPGGNVTLRAEETDDALLIQVIDSGLGIAAADRARIFEKFYRAEDEQAAARGGHGLGLALAREIVALHNGRLQVESEPGEGSTFTIELRKSAHLLQEAV